MQHVQSHLDSLHRNFCYFPHCWSSSKTICVFSRSVCAFFASVSFRPPRILMKIVLLHVLYALRLFSLFLRPIGCLCCSALPIAATTLTQNCVIPVHIANAPDGGDLGGPELVLWSPRAKSRGRLAERPSAADFLEAVVRVSQYLA